MLVSVLVRKFHLIISTTIIISSSFALSLPSGSSIGLNCYDFFIPVQATSLNLQLNDSNLTDTASVASLLASLSTSANTSYIPVTGFFNISSRFCEPQIKVEHRQSSLQLLIHGVTYNKIYWSALDLPGYNQDH